VCNDDEECCEFELAVFSGWTLSAFGPFFLRKKRTLLLSSLLYIDVGELDSSNSKKNKFVYTRVGGTFPKKAVKGTSKE